MNFLGIEINDVWMIFLIAVVLLVIGAALTAYFIIKSKTKTIDLAYLNEIKNAFGNNNIEKVKLEQQRIQVYVKDTKAIDVNYFEEAKLPAFMTGKKITVLFKENANEIYQFLINKGA